MVKRLLIIWACNIAALFVASIFIDGIDYASDFWILLLAGLVFGVVNTFIKPIVKLLALPLIILTFGIALFFVNILMLYVTSWIIGPFQIASFGAAVGGAIIIWLVNAVLHSAFGFEDRGRRKAKAAAGS